MVELVLHSVEGNFVAFNIDFDLWFMQLEPVPRILDSDLKPQLIPNLDSWFQAKTHQRYSLQSFKDIVAAFKLGLSKSYSAGDLRAVALRTAMVTKQAVMERMGEYGRHYWIEALDPVKLETVWAAKVREKFDELRAKLGDDGFHNYLCRLWKFATKHRPGLVVVFERFIKRLGREPQEPVLPQTDDLDAELCKAVLAVVLDRGIAAYRGVPEHVQQRLEILNGRG
jgi:hypothetical protein